MTHTVVTADEEICRLRGSATARTEPSDRGELPVLLLAPSARRALAEVLAFQDGLPPAPSRPTPVAPVWVWLTTLTRRRGRPPGNATMGRAVPATELPVAR